MYSWHTQHLAFHLSLLFSPLPMVIKATRTFTSFFAPPQHTAHTHHRKNWIGKKRNWKSTSIRTRLDFIVSVLIMCIIDSTFPKLTSIPRCSMFFPGQPMDQYFYTCNECNIPLTDKRKMDFNVGQNDSIYLHLMLCLCSKVAYQQGKKRWQHFLFISEFSSGQFHKCLNYCWPRH